MISESTHQIDDKISWHKSKLELAEAQLHYHQEQLSKLLAFKEMQRIGKSLGMNVKQTNQYLELLEAH